MVKLNNFAEQQAQSQQTFNQQKQTNQDFNSTQSQSNQQGFNSQQNQQTQPKGLLTLPPAVLQMVPWIPLMLEMTTGQKVPQMSGTIGEIQNSLVQIQASQAQIINSQNQIWNKLNSLESNAQSQFTNLNQQVQTIQSIRLTHSKESKAIELHRNGSSFDKEQQYNKPRPSPEEEIY